MVQIWNNIWTELKTPFVGPVSIANLFMLVGVVIVASALWALILYHIRLAGTAAMQAV